MSTITKTPRVPYDPRAVELLNEACEKTEKIVDVLYRFTKTAYRK